MDVSFVPYKSARGTVDLTSADSDYRKAIEDKMDHMRRIVVRWVPVMQKIVSLRPDCHWCAYDDGRVVMFVSLAPDEGFGHLNDIYEIVGAHVRHLESLGSYKGSFTPEPDHEDDTLVQWRTWTFKAGDDSRLVLNCSFSMSQHCRLVEEGEETVTVTKRRVVCEEPAFSAAA